MKHIIFFLFISTSVFAQTPRLKFRQIQKDTTQGSIAISNPADSQLVFSRDFYIAYGLTDTVLILYGDTLAATSGIISSVLSDGVTITGNGTSGNELKVDTSLIATIKALNDSLATISASTTPDNVTITGDGSVGNPLSVDTATVISTIQGFLDTLTNRNYLTTNQTITLSGDVTGSGTTAITATVVDDSHNHIISNVDFLQDSLTAKANASELSNYVTIAGTETISGAKTFTNTLTQSGGDANFDSGTLFVDESANRVGIGTSSPSAKFQVDADSAIAVDVTNNRLHVNGTYVPSLSPSARGKIEINGFEATTAFRYKGGFINETNDYGSLSKSVSSTNKRIQYIFYDRNNVQTGKFGVDVANTDDDDFQIVAGSGITPQFSLEANGNLGINNLSPNVALDVIGSIEYTGTITDVSDERLKINKEPLVGITSQLMRLNPIKYNQLVLNDNSLGVPEYGLTAQNVREVFPEMVTTVEQKDGIDYLGLSYIQLISPLIKGFQEQQAIIETQQTEIDQLKTLITDLTNRLIILENK